MSGSNKRIVIIAFLLVSLFSILVIRFYQIQVIEGEKWTKEANRQHFFIIKEPFMRGTFYSNGSVKKDNPENAQRLVTDIEKFHLYIDPESIPERFKEPISSHLMEVLTLPEKEQDKFKDHFSRKSHSRRLSSWLDKSKRDQILEWWRPYAQKRKIPRNALFFQTDFQRSYPFGKLLGQVLHTVQNNRDETTNQPIPTGGLELYFNQYLSGKEGKRRLMRSPGNSLEIGEVIEKPKNGADIYLTINHCLQAIAEEELEKGVKMCKAKSGWAVIMDPYTGEVWALAHYPFFHPPDYKAYFNDPELLEHTAIKAALDANEPGSVIKAVTMAIALKANKELQEKGQKPVFDPEAKMPTSNSRFPGRKNLHDTHFHSFLNMDMALQKSSNIYVARLAEAVIARLGNEWYKRALHECFGFGEKTNIQIAAENPGKVPTPGKKHPNGTLEWSVPTPYSLAMGHNFQANSIQLARAFAVFANGGYLVQPTLVKRIAHTKEDGTEELSYQHQPYKEKVLDSEIAKKVRNALRYTTMPGGTAKKGNILGYTEAGKSGTAQKIINGLYSQTKYSSSFVGFTPVDNPAFVLVVTVDEPEYGYILGIGKNHHGGACSSPIFREIGRRSLEYLGIAPDDPHGYPPGDPRHDSKKAVWANETQRLQEMYEKWNNHSK